MLPFTRNGSFIGRVANFGDTDPYIPGYNIYQTMSFVGANTFTTVGNTSTLSFSLGIPGLMGGDTVVAALAIAFSGTTVPSSFLSGYSSRGLIVSQDSTNVVLKLYSKVMGTTPDSQILLGGGTGSLSNAGAIVVQAWRNVGGFRAVTSSALSNTGIPDPPNVDTIYDNSYVVAAGASGHTGGNDTYSTPFLAPFYSAGIGDSYDVTVGMGARFMASPGPFDCPPFTWTQGDSASYSSASLAIEMYPAFTVVPPSNAKNSGIWDLPSVYKYKAGL